jgi:hypothetical protein
MQHKWKMEAKTLYSSALINYTFFNTLRRDKVEKFLRSQIFSFATTALLGRYAEVRNPS